MYEAICGPQLNTNPFNSAACYITALCPKPCAPVTGLGEVTQQRHYLSVWSFNVLFSLQQLRVTWLLLIYWLYLMATAVCSVGHRLVRVQWQNHLWCFPYLHESLFFPCSFKTRHSSLSIASPAISRESFMKLVCCSTHALDFTSLPSDYLSLSDS